MIHTMNEILDTLKYSQSSRSYILKRIKEELEVFGKLTHHEGHNSTKLYTDEEFEVIINSHIFKGAKPRVEKFKHKRKKTIERSSTNEKTSSVPDNIEIGLYTRITEYGGLYDSRKWEVKG